jgi:hypothetical protein
VPTELPESSGLREMRGRPKGWVPSRTHMALMLVAGFSGYVHWPLFYLLLLALAWISLEAERRVAVGLRLRGDFNYWILTVLTATLFLLAFFEAGRLISLVDEYFRS